MILDSLLSFLDSRVHDVTGGGPVCVSLYNGYENTQAGCVHVSCVLGTVGWVMITGNLSNHITRNLLSG